MDKIEIFENLTKIEIMRKVLIKSTFFVIFENFDQNRNFTKIWPQSKLFEIFRKIEIFRKFWPKAKFFLKIWLKSKLFEIFEKFEAFDQNRNFSKTLP